MALAITERTVRRYCSGETEVPRAIFLALHLIELAMKNDKQREWLAKHGVTLAYVAPDGSDVDVTKRETAQLTERAANFRKFAKKLTKHKS